jgi:regulator of replication initiation timing
MDKDALIKKLEQIEEQARLTLEEFPNLTRERQRMIMALTRFLRAEVSAEREHLPQSHPDEADNTRFRSQS